MSRTVAIMQPTFLPWIGYFALMDRVDEFVFLDSVQFAHRSWQQRNRIKTAQGAQWLTVPVMNRGKRSQVISEVLISGPAEFGRAAMASIRSGYARAPHFGTTQGVLTTLEHTPDHLCDLTIPLILAIKDQLGIGTPCVRSSTMVVAGSRQDLLVSICRARGAERYVSPPGSHVYLDGSTAFEDAGIELAYYHYRHPEYPQLWGAFEPYLSVVDLLFNVGPASLAVIRSGVE